MCKCKTYSVIHVILRSEFNLRMLAKSIYIIYNDTYNTTEYQIVLTTILRLYEDITIPYTYLLSNSQQLKNYEVFYRVHKTNHIILHLLTL
jgi:hypothetical protein